MWVGRCAAGTAVSAGLGTPPLGAAPAFFSLFGNEPPATAPASSAGAAAARPEPRDLSLSGTSGGR